MKVEHPHVAPVTNVSRREINTWRGINTGARVSCSKQQQQQLQQKQQHASHHVDVSPLPRTADPSFDTLAADIKAAPAGPVFVLFSSTEVNGKKWCRGCIDIEPDIERVFANGPHSELAFR